MKTCLLVIDFINDIVDINGKAPSCANYAKENNVIAKANSAIHIARQHSLLTIFVKVAFSSLYYEIPTNSPVFSAAPKKEAFKLGEWGTEFCAELDYHTSDAVIVKPRISPFYATALEAYLRAQKIDTLMISGVSTNNAVQAAARDGHDRDYRVIVLRDACGANNVQIHENSLTLLEQFSTVINVEEMQDYL